MNALMRIHVRIINEASAEAKRVKRDIGGIGSAWSGASRAGGGFAGLLRGNYLEKYGKNLQWTGRQLTYNFTLPLLAAGGAAGKFALDNEKAMTQLRKVYGGPMREVNQLGRAFEALSNIFGVHQDEVIQIGAAWASAGSSGIALARQTRATLEAMIIGDMDAEQATKALIAIQAQYRLSSKELTQTLAMLNTVENVTAVTMQDLILGFQRSAGAARNYGVDARHLAAAIAALVPATGGAEQAGQALKTIYTRLMVPTRETAKVLEMVGINMADQAWNSKNATERLEQLAQATEGLTNGQKAVVARYVASNWQVARFDVLMEQLTKNTGYYQRALDKTADSQKNMATYTRELGIYLSSQPQAFAILWNQLRNAMAEIIVPLIPAILALVQKVVNLVHAFTDLSPGTQQMILLGLAALAALGPFLQYTGAVILLISKLKGAIIVFTEVGFGLFKVLGFVILNLATLARLPFSLIASGISAIGSAVGWVFTTLMGTGIKTALTGLVSAFGTMISTIVRFLVVGLGQAVLLAGSAIANGWAGVMAAVQYITNAAVTAVQAMWGALVFAAQLVWGAITTVVSVASGLIPLYQRVAATASMVVWNLFTGAFAAAAAAWPVFVSAAGVAITTTWTFITQAMSFLTAAFGAAFSAIWTALPVIVRAVGTAMVFIQQATWTAIVALWGAIPAIAEAIGTAITVAFSGPWGWVILAVVAFVVAFRKQIASLISWVINNWREIPNMFVKSITDLQSRLTGFPKVVLNVFVAVLKIIKQAALQVYEWLSYINPFAHHSPSLVEQVTAGVDLIARKYASLSGIGKNFRRAIGDLRAFGDATAAAVAANRASERAEMRSNVVAVAPGAGPAFDALAGSVDRLYGDLARVGRQYAAQEAVVARWASRLDAANRALDAQEGTLKLLSLTADRYGKIIDAAQAKIDKFASAPLQGMRAMGDQIFANEMAQKRLQLAMLEWEKVNGPLDDIESRLSAITGDIEQLRGEAKELRMAGAGSDITGPIEEQVAALEEQAAALRQQAGPMQTMKDQLEALATEGQRLELLNSLRFDPLQRQIDQLVEGMNELPFDQIVNGIKAQQSIIAGVTPAWDAATAAVERQQAVVDALTAARDRLQVGYDREKGALDDIGTAYDAIETQIRDMEQAMSDFASMAEQALSKAKQAKDAAGGSLTAGQEAFLNAGTGDYEIPGGTGDIERELGDINKLADQWAEEAKKEFGSFDIFGGFKDMWKGAIKWVDEHVPMIRTIAEKAQDFWNGTGPDVEKIKKDWAPKFRAIDEEIRSLQSKGRPLTKAEELRLIDLKATKERMKSDLAKIEQMPREGGMKEKLSNLWNGLTGAGDLTVLDGLKKSLADFGTWLMDSPIGTGIKKIREVWDQFFPGLKQAFEVVKNFIVDLGKAIGDELENWSELWEPLKEAVGHVMKAIGVSVTIGVGFLIAAWNLLWPIVHHVVKPVFDAIVGVIKAALQIIRGVIGFVLAIINGDWGAAWDAVLTVLNGIWDAIYSVIKGAIGVVIGVVRGFIEGVIAAFTWLWDVLVGHSIVPDLMNAIIGWFKFLFSVVKVVWNALWAIVSWAWNSIIKPVLGALGAFISNVLVPVFKFLWAAAQTVWNGIAAVISWVWNSVIMPVFDAIKQYIQDHQFEWLQFKFMVEHVWGQVKQAIVDAWETKIKPALQAVWDFITNTLVPVFLTLWSFVSAAFSGIVAVVKWAWENVIKPLWTAIQWYVSNILVPAFQFIWTIVSNAFKGIVAVIQWAWNNIIKPLWAAIKWYIENVLSPVFAWLKDKITEAWNKIKSGISTAWDLIKPILQGVRDFVNDKVMPIWNTLKDTVLGAFNSIKDKIGGIWNGIGSAIKSGINIAIDAINTLIDGLNKVADILPGVDFHLNHIPRLATGGSIGSSIGGAMAGLFATGTAHLPRTEVGGGFKTNGARAIVGEGRVGYPEYVIPTDPKYRQRAFGLAHALLRDLTGARPAGRASDGHPAQFAIGGVIPTPGDVWNGIKSTGEYVADKAISGAYAPFSALANRLIDGIPWVVPREMAKGIKGKVDEWVKGSDDALGLGNAAQAALISSIPHKPGVNMNLNKDFLRRYAAYNNELGNPFTVVSGLRTYAQQVALYQAYLNGTGNLAAKPGTSNHESGYALDHAPGTQGKAIRFMDMARKHGLKYPVPGEDWHVEPIVRAMQGGVLNMARGGRFIARPKPGGHLVRVAEAGQAEGVTVEPLSSFKDGGGDTFNFYGNLEFPNITDPDEAQKFIDNLRDLGGGD